MNFSNVKSIIKKELRGYFNHPLGYILLAVFLALGNFFFFRTAFLSGEASLRPFFELLPWFLLFLVPAVTMKAIAAEQKEGTLEIVLAQPITELELLIGKFLGDFLFILIAVGLTLLLPLTLSLGGKLDWRTVFAQYLGAIFLSAGLVALGLLASTVTKNQTVAFIVSLFATFALLVMGLDIVVMGLPYPLNDIFGQLSILRHFDSITRGVIDLRDIVYFLSLGFVFISITYLIFMARKLNRKAKKYQTLQTGIALMVAIAIVVNLFGAFISFRLDFTEQKLYSLSKGTITVLKQLDDVITVKFFASKELPSQVSLLYRDIKDTLQDYKNASGRRLQFVQKFPDENEDSAEEAQKQGIQPVQFNVMKSDEFSVKEGYLGISVQFGDKKEIIPFVQSTDDLEYQLTSLIRKVSSDDQKKVVFIGGHGEKDIYKDYQDFNQALSKQYQVESAEKKDLAKKLKGADVAIIAGPKQKFSKEEKQNLTTFINSGKSALFLIDSVDVNMQYGFAMPNKESFADFTEQFGLKVNKDLVYDLQANEQVPFGGGGGTSYILPYPFWPKLAVNPKHIVTNRLKEIVLPWASSVSLVKEKLGKAKAEALLQTSDGAGHQTSNYNVSPDPKTNALSQKGLKKYVMGYALNNVGESSKGRLVVIGDSDFLSKDFVGRYPQAAGLIFNSIDWLSQDELLIGIRSKNSAPSPLRFESEATKNFVRYFNMVGVVLIVVGYGLFRMNRRRKLAIS